jgi:ATP-dependent DNA ligase
LSPSTHAVFDLLRVIGRDLRELSLTNRKARLERVLSENGPTVFKVLTVEEKTLPGTRSRIRPTHKLRAGA